MARREFDASGIYQHLRELDRNQEETNRAIEAADADARKKFPLGILLSTLIAIALIYPSAWVGAREALSQEENAHHRYVDAHRPCAAVEDAVFDLPAATVEYYYDPHTGNISTMAKVSTAVNGTWLHLYAVHVHNEGTGHLRDLRLVETLPGSAFVTTTTRAETLIDAIENDRAVLTGAGGFPKIARQDPRLTFSRGFQPSEPEQEIRYTMASGNRTPTEWSHIFAWTPNVFGARDNQIVTYHLPSLEPGGEWWIGTWYYQPTPDWNQFDKGATISAWSQGYDGPLTATAELTGLYTANSRGRLSTFCNWSG